MSGPVDKLRERRFCTWPRGVFVSIRYDSQPDLFDRPRIAELQRERLQSLLGEVSRGNAFWQHKFAQAGIDTATVRTPDDLRRLPFTTKDELLADHAQFPPYGSNLTQDVARYGRMHQTSGTTGTPLRWLDTPRNWDWILECWAQIYRMVGLTADDVLAFPFSFGPFLGFWAAFEGASRLGNLCLPGGGMSSQARLKLIEDNRATVVCCTPTYALRLADVADEEGIDLASGSVRALIVAGEPGGSIQTTRSRIEEAWGARVFDHWGMTEIGSLAVECHQERGGLHVLETECIAEVIDPRTLEPAAAGAVGELVVTNLGRVDSPLIRYRTGDLVQVDPRPCSCGRALARLKDGILGRVDDMVSIRGNNVYPSSIEEALRSFIGIAEYRITVVTRRAMQQLKIELEPIAGADAASLVAAVDDAIRKRFNFRAEVASVPAGSLPRFELKGRRFFRDETSAH